MSQAEKPRLAILISGRGSNLQAFIDACASEQLAAQISIVISNNPDAPGLHLAAAAGLPVCCVNHRDFSGREAFDQALVDELNRHAVDLVILAGFMRILTPVFVEPFAGRLMNIHPSLLPKYPGLHTHQRALDAGDAEAGVTVHFVTLELDGGPPIVQSRIPILPDDTTESLAARAIEREHVIYPLAAGWYLAGRLTLDDQTAYLDDNQIPATGIDYRDDLA